MINAVIIDDEQNNIDNLKSLLRKHCSEVEISGTAINAKEGREIILHHNPDIVFLDIQMPGENGFDLLKSLSNYSFEVIFVTAFDQYGIKAVKFAAIDYLLKPINVDELKIAVKKAIDKKQRMNQNEQLQNLMQLLKDNQKEHRIALPSTHEIRYAKPSEIIRCESSNNYTTFHFVSREKLLISKPIYFYEELLLDYNFVRCHQSHLVNKKFISSFIKEDSGSLLLEDQTRIPVSKSKKEKIKEWLSKR
ncbi:MAG: LytTR family DNA-binding domain-containing protein [Ferruginibacter sp.]